MTAENLGVHVPAALSGFRTEVGEDSLRRICTVSAQKSPKSVASAVAR
jgi:hypothetical protein